MFGMNVKMIGMLLLVLATGCLSGWDSPELTGAVKPGSAFQNAIDKVDTGEN